MATPNPVRGADDLRTLTAIAAPPSASRLRQQKRPLSRGAFLLVSIRRLLHHHFLGLDVAAFGDRQQVCASWHVAHGQHGCALSELAGPYGL